MPRPLMLTLLLGLALVGCDDGDPGSSGFDPDAIDFDAVTVLDYGDYVGPLLAARNVFADTATDDAGEPADYTWDALFGSDWGETIVPFDAEHSLVVRFVEDLASDVALPYPNLRDLQEDEVTYLKRWIEAGARNDEGDVPYADAEHLMYAAVQGANYVAVIDAERRQVIRNIYFDDHGLSSAPYGPHHMVFEPDRSAIYVSLISRGTVVRITGDLGMDPSDPAYVLAHSAPGAFDSPGMMALDHDTERLYVGRSTLSPAGTNSTFGVFHAHDLDLEAEYTVPGSSFPHALALTPDGSYVLTAPLAGNVAYSFDAATGDLVSQAPVGGGGVTRELVHFAVLPEGTVDGFTATLTANNPTSEVLFFNVGAGGALTLDGAVATGGERAWHAHLDRDGVTLMVPNRNSDTVALIDVPSRVVTMTAPSGSAPAISAPHSPAPTHDGTFFVSNSNWPTSEATWAPPYPFLDDDGQPLPNEAFGNVVALNAETGAVEKTILLGAYPSGLEHWHGEGGHGHGDMQHGGHEGH